MADISHVKQGDEVVVTIKGKAVSLDGRILRIRTNCGYATYLNSDYLYSVEVTKKAKPEWWPLRSGDVFFYREVRGVPDKMSLRYVHGTEVLDIDGMRRGFLDYYNADENIGFSEPVYLVPRS